MAVGIICHTVWQVSVGCWMCASPSMPPLQRCLTAVLYPLGHLAAVVAGLGYGIVTNAVFDVLLCSAPKTITYAQYAGLRNDGSAAARAGIDPSSPSSMLLQVEVAFLRSNRSIVCYEGAWQDVEAVCGSLFSFQVSMHPPARCSRCVMQVVTRPLTGSRWQLLSSFALVTRCSRGSQSPVPSSHGCCGKRAFQPNCCAAVSAMSALAASHWRQRSWSWPVWSKAKRLLVTRCWLQRRRPPGGACLWPFPRPLAGRQSPCSSAEQQSESCSKRRHQAHSAARDRLPPPQTSRRVWRLLWHQSWLTRSC